MRNERAYNYEEEAEISESLRRAKRLCGQLNQTLSGTAEYRAVLRELIPGVPDDSEIMPPFFCDHGHGIRMGHNVFLNHNCVALDGGYITFGDNVKVGPACQFYTPQHPKDYVERRGPVETAHPIDIGEDTWLGGGVIVCPGVSIGKRCIVAAGSVVVRDIPDDCLAAGNPAEVKKRLR